MKNFREELTEKQIEKLFYNNSLTFNKNGDKVEYSLEINYGVCNIDYTPPTIDWVSRVVTNKKGIRDESLFNINGDLIQDEIFECGVDCYRCKSCESLENKVVNN